MIFGTLGILDRLHKKDADFIPLFMQAAEKIQRSTELFLVLLKDLENSSLHVQAISDVEHQADEIIHTTMELLHQHRKNPKIQFDRETVRELISKMDDVVDMVHAAAQRIRIYKIKEVPAEIQRLAQICEAAGKLIFQCVQGLRGLHEFPQMLKACVEINRLENEADQVLRAGVGRLFEEESDLKQLIKMKELYEILESVSDRCEDVANVIEGIVLEYAK